MELILTVLSKQKALIQVINPDRIWVLYHTSVSTHFIENCEKVLRSLCTRFIFILVIVLARCSLCDDHCSTYNVCPFFTILFVQLSLRINSRQLSLHILTPDFSRACHVTLARVFLWGYMKLEWIRSLILFTLGNNRQQPCIPHPK